MPGEDTVVGVNPSTQQGQSSGAQQGDGFILDFGDGEALESMASRTSNEDLNVKTMVNNGVEGNTFNDFDISMGEDASEEVEEDKVVEDVEPEVEAKEEQEPEVELDLSDTVEDASEEVEEDKVVEDVEPEVEAKGEQEPEVENLNSETLSNLNVSSTAKLAGDTQFSKDKLMDEIALLDDSPSLSAQSKILEQLKEEGDLSSKLNEETPVIEGDDITSNDVENNLVENGSIESGNVEEKDSNIIDKDFNQPSIQGKDEESSMENMDVNSNVENYDQGFTLDYNVESQNNIDESMGENVSESNVQETGQGVDGVSDNLDATQKLDTIPQEVEVQSTLSLDQILDSELLSSQQFVDNSVAVPINKPEAKGNKKLVVALAGIGLLLAGFVVVLAFPGGNQGREDYEVINESENVLDSNHGSSEIVWPEDTVDDGEQNSREASSIDADMVTSNYEVQEKYDGESEVMQDNYSHNNSTTSSVTFPDVGGDDQSDYIDISVMDPTVYTGYTENWTEEIKEGNDSAPSISVKEVSDLISSFKSQAEVYYTYGQENQDRYLIKYAAKILYLCDTYEQELEGGENVDVEKLEGFKTEVNGLILKIESHNGGEEKPILVQSTSEESSNFEGKDEIKDYLYSK